MYASTMTWNEDTVSFRGVVRRSGNSLIATIPTELSQRFLIREGQEFTIVGMSRFSPDFEGALQIYLGFFKVLEKAVTLSVKVDDGRDVFEKVEAVGRRYGATRLVKSYMSDGKAEIKIIFGVVEKNKTRMPRKIEEIREMESNIKHDLESLGVRVLSSSITEDIYELRDIDPAVISKNPSKLEGLLTWKWEI